MSAAKTRYPRAIAIRVAREIVNLLRPVCEPDRLIVAGSLRRRKTDVGDIELVYIPRFGPAVPEGCLFETGHCNLADIAIEDMLGDAVLKPRKTITGAETWGQKNKLCTHIATGIPVDLFATNELSWHNYLVCRTGSAENNIAIAQAATAKGLQWKPYRSGFLDLATGHLIPVTSERDVYHIAGLEYRDPWDRG